MPRWRESESASAVGNVKVRIDSRSGESRCVRSIAAGARGFMGSWVHGLTDIVSWLVRAYPDRVINNKAKKELIYN